uniref:Ig-like domain-containing protein n=2 Tax=Meleagris gallopavo TaxID=9103 RepID=A0A803YDC6_MELGA
MPKGWGSPLLPSFIGKADGLHSVQEKGYSSRNHACHVAGCKPTFMKAPEDQIGISGGVASFVCQATGEPKPRITWMKKGKKVSSQRFEVIEFDDGSGSVLRIQPLRVHRDEAIYECTATNSVGEINTSAKLTVLEGKWEVVFVSLDSSGFGSCVVALLNDTVIF